MTDEEIRQLVRKWLHEAGFTYMSKSAKEFELASELVRYRCSEAGAAVPELTALKHAADYVGVKEADL